MSNLLDKASILLTPTAYDNGSMLSVKPENGDGDFDFSRNSAATRVNAQGLVENVQIISPELVSNGNFSQIGTEEVSNGNFSQEGSELVTNGSFDTDSNWTKGTGWSIDSGDASCDGTQTSNSNLFQAISFTVGKQYKVSYEISNFSSGTVKIVFGDTGGILRSANGNYIEYFTFVSGSNFYIQANSDFTGSIDNVSVKEVGQNWTLQNGWSIEDNKAIFSGSVSSYRKVFQENIITIGKQYKLTFEIDSISSGSIANFGYSESFNTIGIKTQYFTAIYDDLYLEPSNDAVISVTNISVKEVGQDWTFETGWSVDQANSKAVSDGTSSNSNLFTTSAFYSGNPQVKISLSVTDYVSGTLQLYINNSFNPIITANGDYTFYTLADRSDGTLALKSRSFIGSVSNISVKEITDDTDIPRINYEGFSYQDSLGSELVVNGDFSNGTNNWTPNAAATLSIDNGKLKVLINGTSGYPGQFVDTIIGKTYKITADGFIGTSSRIALYNDADGQFRNLYADGSFNFTFIATSTSTQLRLYVFDNGAYGLWNNVSVKEYLGQSVVPDSGCGSWLLEPQSTNLVTYSEDFSQWTQRRVSITNNEIISPDGTTNASLITEDSTLDTRYFFLNFTVTTNPHSLSFFAKDNGQYLQVLFGTSDTTGDVYINFDLENGTYDNNGVTNPSMEDFGNGWYKISLQVTPIVTSDFGVLFSPVPSLTSSRLPSYQGDGASGVYIYGAQVEQGSYATSYIPTNGATSTRLQDIANNSGNSTLINSTEGVLYAEIAALTDDVSISLSDNTFNNSISFGVYLDKISAVIRKDGGYITSGIIDTSTNAFNNNKIAIKYNSSSCDFYVNGLVVGSSSGVTYSSDVLDNLNFDRGSGHDDFYGKCKTLAVYKEALTDANLRSLTYPNPVATTFDLDFDTIAEQFTFTRGSEATFVNAQGLIESTASNDAPRIDYSTGAEAFLLEPQSTNLITYSESFSGWGLDNATIVGNNTISPNGTQNAVLLKGNANSSRHNIVRPYSQQNANTAFSIFVKAKELKYVQIATANDVNQYVNFDVSIGVIGTVGSTFSNAKIEDYGNGWYRLSAVATRSNGLYLSLVSGLSASWLESWTMSNNTDGLYIWGAQAEISSYPTSYIPTSGASATRNQELCNNATPVINSEEGTLYAEISALANDVTNRTIGILGDSNNYIELAYRDGANEIRALIVSSGSVQASMKFTISDATLFNKVAIKWKVNDAALWINGVEVLTDTILNIPSGLSELNFYRFDATDNFFGNTKGLKVYPKALADVQLEDLTTI